jgi:methylmalonyl-CoA mutase cobalamin-binding subunit
MYTIRQAAARTGLPVPTIRAWERRYGVVHPARTAAGYRLYDETAIERLLAMRRLVDDDGWRPSQASERVLSVGDDLAELTALGRPAKAAQRELGPGEVPSGDATAGALRAAESIDAFLGATSEIDIGALDAVLDTTFASQRFEPAMHDVVFPALRGVGERWSTGAIDVAAEHAASETIRRRLGQLYEAAGRPLASVPILVGLPPGSRHELGAFAFAVAARRAGLDVVYLGADVPLESWLRAARETGAPIVVLGVVTGADLASARAVADGLRRLDPAPQCFVGGPPAAELGPGSGLRALPDALDAAVSQTVEALGP